MGRENNLNYAGAVAQVNENNLAMIAAVVNPAKKFNGLADQIFCFGNINLLHQPNRITKKEVMQKLRRRNNPRLVLTKSKIFNKIIVRLRKSPLFDNFRHLPRETSS
jgi:hypothetical protein